MPGKGVLTLNYPGANSGSMTLRLFFDTTDGGTPVTNYTDQLLALMEIDTSLPGSNENTNNARPPSVIPLGEHALVQSCYLSASVSSRISRARVCPYAPTSTSPLRNTRTARFSAHRTRHRGPRSRNAPIGCNQGRPWTASRPPITATRPIGGLLPTSMGSRTRWPLGQGASWRYPNSLSLR